MGVDGTRSARRWSIVSITHRSHCSIYCSPITTASLLEKRQSGACSRQGELTARSSFLHNVGEDVAVLQLFFQPPSQRIVRIWPSITQRGRVVVETMFLINVECYQEHVTRAISGTMSLAFCVPDTKFDIPDIIWNNIPNYIRHHILLITSDF